MIRIVVRWTNYGAAANVGGPVEAGVRTFDVVADDLERYLSAPCPHGSCEVIGAHVVEGSKVASEPIPGWEDDQ